MSYPYQSQTPPPAPVCYRHPDRVTYVGCTRCGRPACPECMRSASVGHQCVDCVQAAAYAGPTTLGPPAGVGRGLAVRGAVPIVTYALIAVNVVAFVMAVASRQVQGMLALWPPAVAAGDYYRLVTSTFMHDGLMHIGFNMWALYVLGPPLEQHLGRLRFGTLYGLSALGGSVMVYLLSPLNEVTVGASGAIFGLFGATLLAAKRLHLDTRWLIALIAINLVMTFSIPGISWQGHIGGLITGALTATMYLYVPRIAAQVGFCAGMLALFGVLILWRTNDIQAQFGPMLTH